MDGFTSNEKTSKTDVTLGGYEGIESDLPLLPIIVSQDEVELLVSGVLVEGDNVGQHVDVAQPLPEHAEQGVL